MKKAAILWVFIGAIVVLFAGQALFALAGGSLFATIAALVIFFTAFNLLEATLPSLISKFAPPGVKGTASGVYSAVQFLGAFVGAAFGGWLSQHYGAPAVFAFCLVLTALWLAVSATMSSSATLAFHMRITSSATLALALRSTANAAVLSRRAKSTTTIRFTLSLRNLKALD